MIRLTPTTHLARITGGGWVGEGREKWANNLLFFHILIIEVFEFSGYPIKIKCLHLYDMDRSWHEN